MNQTPLSPDTFTPLFQAVFRANHLESYTKPAIVDKFRALTDRLLAVNAVMNLTALDTPEKIIPLHYADCALIADRIPAGATVADVGCGGGFPTFPLAILRPDLHITAIDSTGKKIKYVEETAQLLGLANIRAVTARAEELGRDAAWREQFDLVTSRAVARLSLLDELCLPLCRAGGGAAAPEGCGGAGRTGRGTRGNPAFGRRGGGR